MFSFNIVTQKIIMTLMSLKFILGLLSLANTTYADRYSNADFTLNFNSNLKHSPFIEIKAMDTEQLYLAAEAQRDTSMKINNQKVNCHWLYTYRAGRYSGSKALRKFMRLSLSPYLLPKFKAAYNPSDNLEPLKNKSQFKTLENYQFDISSDSLEFGFQYKF